MRITRYLRIPVYFFAVFLVLAILAENYVLSGGIRPSDVKRFNKKLHTKLEQIDAIMSIVANKLDTIGYNDDSSNFSLLSQVNNLFEDKEQAILVTNQNEAVYWSDHVVAFFNDIVSAEQGLVELPNGWFVLSRKTQGQYVIHGLTLIKYNYQVDNEYLPKTFAKGFHLPADFKVQFYESDESFPVFDTQNSFLFAIRPSGLLPCIYSDLYVPVVLYMLALFFLLMTLYRVSNHYFHRLKGFKIVALLLLMVLLYWVMEFTRLPQSVFLLNIFTPQYFAYSALWKSMGEMMVFSILLLFWSVVFARSFDISDKTRQNAVKLKLTLVFCFSLLALFFVVIRFLVHTLVLNSSISFSIYRIETLSVYSFFGFVIIGLFYLAFFFVTFRTTQVFRKNVDYSFFFLQLLIISVVLGFLLLKLDPTGNLRLNLFFTIIAAACFWANKSRAIKHRFSLVVLFVLVYSLFAINTLIPFNEKKQRKVQELMSLNLSVEHDPLAELFLRDIDKQLKTDTLFLELLWPPYNDAFDYISRKYFGGYMREYEFQFTICSPVDSVMVHPENVLQPCYPFFNEMIEQSGSQITGTNFHFLDNMNGRITYMGRYVIKPDNGGHELAFFIELNSKLLSEGTGFPELLLPSHSIENKIKGDFSFAKYNNNELVDRGGEYLYALTAKSYNLPNAELGFARWDGHEHCIYRLENNNFILVSRPLPNMYNYLLSFPYVFVFLFLMSLLVSFASKPYLNIMPVQSSLRQRIQISIIGLVFIALLVVGSGTILYNIAQYRSNHRNDLIDKINAVSGELTMVIGKESTFDNQMVEYLYYELIRISDIFWTDVNIYDLDGNLVVSSRPEVFEKGLISTQMDNAAIFNLKRYEPTRFVHHEHIASMEYLSAYVPFLNFDGRNIGYINIPYFTKQREFRTEITTFIFAFINIYVFLLMLSVMVAFFISGRITYPLRLVLENLRVIQLGKETKPIEYRSDDEIGLLVAEYNKKLEELAYSTELLARSERETAWREMAKQIAHEIKNPLTPMKLNIQFLQRTTPSNSADYSEKVKKVTETLIEQIDNLSSIATEFSNFAQMPRTKNEQFLLTERLSEIIKLYNYTGQVSITTHFIAAEKFKVFADKEQFARAILNLIKNAIQAIPENRKGKIDIEVKKAGRNAIIKISDNGKGIDESLKELIFVPNFTTKSSGTGLGLAITKNIVDHFGGNIWYESEVGIGTRFFISIPLI